MGLALAEKRAQMAEQEAARRKFQAEFIHFYKMNLRLLKKDAKCMNTFLATRQALISVSGIHTESAYTERSCREIEAYWRNVMGFKTESELYAFTNETWRNRLAFDRY